MSPTARVPLWRLLGKPLLATGSGAGVEGSPIAKLGSLLPVSYMPLARRIDLHF